jgi:hypothetical protein
MIVHRVNDPNVKAECSALRETGRRVEYGTPRNQRQGESQRLAWDFTKERKNVLNLCKSFTDH